MNLALAIFVAGCAQLCVLIASSLVPLRLQWRTSLGGLPRLHRQLYWIYGGYVVLAIIANGVVCILNADELAAGSTLARCLCAYIAIFWGVRLSLQAVLDVKEHLTAWWLHLGYHALTLMFVAVTKRCQRCSQAPSSIGPNGSPVTKRRQRRPVAVTNRSKRWRADRHETASSATGHRYQSVETVHDLCQ
jgi:hypothetical protein